MNKTRDQFSFKVNYIIVELNSLISQIKIVIILIIIDFIGLLFIYQKVLSQNIFEKVTFVFLTKIIKNQMYKETLMLKEKNIYIMIN